jgi:hypothetical protein
MSDEDLMYIEKSDSTYKRIIHLDGVTTTISNNKFEISVRERNEVWEQLAVQQLREWIKWRKSQEKL